jgi:hypothetical protein
VRSIARSNLADIFAKTMVDILAGTLADIAARDVVDIVAEIDHLLVSVKLLWQLPSSFLWFCLLQ